jgi:TrmH family RNA methyltransferase
MLLSKNKIKYLSSLKIKKFRDANRQFIIEGDKIVKDTLQEINIKIDQIIATPLWLSVNRTLITPSVREVFEADIADISRITSFETAPPVIALLDMPQISKDFEGIFGTLSIALDSIQDPGNLGTIIRTADWFGIGNIFCSEGCTDIYNPKVIQASMGSIFHVNVQVTDLLDLLKKSAGYADFISAGTFMHGTALHDIKPLKKGIILFGNESRGISGEYAAFIKQRITIPPVYTGRTHVESLNVASSVAITLAILANHG